MQSGMFLQLVTSFFERLFALLKIAVVQDILLRFRPKKTEDSENALLHIHNRWETSEMSALSSRALIPRRGRLERPRGWGEGWVRTSIGTEKYHGWNGSRWKGKGILISTLSILNFATRTVKAHRPRTDFSELCSKRRNEIFLLV